MMVMHTAGGAVIETTGDRSSSVVVGGYGARRRRWVETRDGIETPAGGRWTVLAGPLEHGRTVTGGALDIGAGEDLEASLVIASCAGSIRTRLVGADRLGNWSFAGGMTFEGAHLEVALRVRYQGVFAGGARPVALFSLMGLERAEGDRRRRRGLRHLLVGDVNLTPQPSSG